MNWQPIESAPKDGSAILAYADGSMTTVAWFAIGDYWSLVEPGGWAEDGEWAPTHWMPLPAPPEGEPRYTITEVGRGILKGAEYRNECPPMPRRTRPLEGK